MFGIFKKIKEEDTALRYHVMNGKLYSERAKNQVSGMNN